MKPAILSLFIAAKLMAFVVATVAPSFGVDLRLQPDPVVVFVLSEPLSGSGYRRNAWNEVHRG